MGEIYINLIELCTKGDYFARLTGKKNDVKRKIL